MADSKKGKAGCRLSGDEKVAVQKLMAEFKSVKGNRYGGEYLFFCIGWLSDCYGLTKQAALCQLLACGLESHPVFSGRLDEMREAAGLRGLLPDSASGFGFGASK